VISDRYVGYHWLDILQQQLCWAHWVRSLVALSERQGAPGKLARKLLKAARSVIRTHHAYLEDDHDLDWLRERLTPLRTQIQTLLQTGARGHDQKTANFCAGLLEEYDALWTFCDVQDLHIPMDNNAAERALRHAVILTPCAGKNPVRSRQPLDRADPLDPRNDAPPKPARARLPHPSRDRRPPPPASPITTRRRPLNRARATPAAPPADHLNAYHGHGRADVAMDPTRSRGDGRRSRPAVEESLVIVGDHPEH